MKFLLWRGLCLTMGILPIISHAQHVSIGGGIPYNVSVKTPGLNLRAYYNVSERFCFGPEFTFFLPKKESYEDEEIETTIWELNLNLHYIFELHERLGFYPILGLNYTWEKERITLLPDQKTEENVRDAFGLNVGGGLHVPLPKCTPFLEYEYVASDLRDHLITLGVFFDIGKENQSLEMEK